MRRSSRCATSASHSRASASGRVELAPGRLVQQAVEPVAHGRQLQPPQHLRQGRRGDRGAAHHAPPAARSYSASGRSRSAPARRDGAPGAASRRRATASPTTMPRRWAGSTARSRRPRRCAVARHLRARVQDPHLAAADDDADLARRSAATARCSGWCRRRRSRRSAPGGSARASAGTAAGRRAAAAPPPRRARSARSAPRPWCRARACRPPRASTSARCASSAAQLAKLRPAMALRLT